MYLDCDTIIKNNIDNNLLLVAENQETLLRMVPEIHSTISRDSVNLILKQNNINIQLNKYFNAGVFIVKTENITSNMFNDLINCIKFNFRLND